VNASRGLTAILGGAHHHLQTRAVPASAASA